MQQEMQAMAAVLQEGVLEGVYRGQFSSEDETVAARRI